MSNNPCSICLPVYAVQALPEAAPVAVPMNGSLAARIAAPAALPLYGLKLNQDF